MTSKLRQPGRIDATIYQAAHMASIVIGETSIKELIERQLLKHPEVRKQHEAILGRKKVYDHSSENSKEASAQ